MIPPGASNDPREARISRGSVCTLNFGVRSNQPGWRVKPVMITVSALLHPRLPNSVGCHGFDPGRSVSAFGCLSLIEHVEDLSWF